MAEVSSSVATLVSTDLKNDKIKVKRLVKYLKICFNSIFQCDGLKLYTHRSRKKYLIIVGALVCVVGLIIATGLLVDQGILKMIYLIMEDI